ncbi:MAG TPA: 4-(cytidine 5'-diphospho)-2-C-methyl-D-erythritol kinase [Thermoanaerobaculia bacterium]|nr:4-(cytidine 5'-diphospho)-2-C-methyl-D-erythritol kinase [Thermoanaerobaculia bacterium]
MKKSYAKINWALRITGRRADGFHDLETVFQTISFHDELTFTPAPGLTLTCDDPTIPTDDTNLVIRAAKAVGANDVAIHLRKRIPAGGGLGGGSSNAAAVLQEFGGDRDLAEIALRLGSDVPFFLAVGTAYATGRGEVLTPMTPMPNIPLLLVLPEERVLTKEAFARVTRYSPTLGIDAYRDFANFTNDFEEPVFAMLPQLAAYKARLYDSGATWAGMSGSGSTIVGAFASEAARDSAQRAFADVRTERCTTI